MIKVCHWLILCCSLDLNLPVWKGFGEMELNKDVVGLLAARLREMVFSTGGIQEPFVSLTDSFRHLAAINQ
jgi:hypothetical protein